MSDFIELRRIITNKDDKIEELIAEVERMRAENANLRVVLKPFADYADPTNRMPADLTVSAGSWRAKRQLTMGDCYVARRALEEGK